MYKQVVGTIAARIVTTAAGLLVAMIAGHLLGTEGLGTIGLITLGITLIRIGTDILGGGGLVYLVPRVPLNRLLSPCYSWSFFAAAAGYAVVHLFALVPPEYALDVALLALLQGVHAVNTAVLIGQQRIRANNILTMLQALLLVGVFALLARHNHAGVESFITASYVSIVVVLAMGLWAIRKKVMVKGEGPLNVLGLLVAQGVYVQASNGLQLMNYRLAYWFIEKFRSTSALGIYSVANQLAEGSWLVPKSLALVLYSRISNTPGKEEQRLLTLAFLKLSMAFAAAVVLVLLLLPSTLFRLAFGPEILGIAPLIALLAPGIMAMAASQAFSHFFSGTARNLHNVVGSGLGLVFSIAAGLILIPGHGLNGAAITASMAYLANGLYQAVAFMRITDSSFRDLWPNRADVGRVRALFPGRTR